MNRVTVGIALSIAVHGALLLALRYQAAPVRIDQAVAPREMVVLLLRASPPPPVAVAPAPAVPEPPPARKPKPTLTPAPAARQEARRAQADPRPRAAQTEVIALPATAADKPADEGRFSVAPVEAGPTFDPNAAKAFARSIATKPDPARAGMAVAQIPEKPLETETKAARAIASAKRRDCKDGLPGGLLGPLILLLDKKDSGCKW